MNPKVVTKGHLAYALQRLTLKAVIGAGGAAVMVVLAAWGLSERGVTRAEAAGVAAAKGLAVDLAATKAAQAQENADSHEESREVRKDIRALSAQVREFTGIRSPRLEAPLPPVRVEPPPAALEPVP